ncbi:MAG: NrfD/PsrC family molybdoenzyme membrane anchor subunit [Eggerthella lenta]
MFNVLTTSYLFLGGTGAGALAVLCVLECARVLRWRALAMPEEFFARAWPMCTVTLATGMLCLLVDLGRPDRLLGLFASPAPSVMAAGSFALVAALACAAAFSLGALLDTVRLPRAAVLALAAAGALSAAVTATYTGALLQSLASVLLWRTSPVPVLFVLSSASCGIRRRSWCLVRGDAAPYRGPLVCLRGLTAVSWSSRLAACLRSCCSRSRAGDAAAAARALAFGELAPVFWGVLAVCGWPCRWCWSASSRMGTAARSFCG